MEGVTNIAIEGAKLIKELTDECSGETNIRFEYSPESFSGTEPENAVYICDKVMEALGSTEENPVILNLPNTVEMCTPNTFADQVEYFINNEQGELTSLNGFIEAGKTLEIKVVIYVDNVANNAVLGGSLSLVLTSLGE